jgi:hypothetical protein
MSIEELMGRLLTVEETHALDGSSRQLLLTKEEWEVSKKQTRDNGRPRAAANRDRKAKCRDDTKPK